MEYKFVHTDNGVETDKEVQRYASGLSKLNANGTLQIEAGYKGTHSAYCKITGLGKPIETTGKKVGAAVNDAVKIAGTIVRDSRETHISKKRNASAKFAKKSEEEIEDSLEA